MGQSWQLVTHFRFLKPITCLSHGTMAGVSQKCAMLDTWNVALSDILYACSCMSCIWQWLSLIKYIYIYFFIWARTFWSAEFNGKLWCWSHFQFYRVKIPTQRRILWRLRHHWTYLAFCHFIGRIGNDREKMGELEWEMAWWACALNTSQSL